MNTDMEDSSSPNGYLLLFRDTSWDRVPRAEYQQVMDRMMAWFGELDRQGKLAGARPLLDGGKTVSGKDGRSVTDGPFPESKEAIGGYVLLNTDSEEEAVEIARTNPMLEYGLTVEVRATTAVCPKFQRVKSQLASSELAGSSAK